MNYDFNIMASITSNCIHKYPLYIYFVLQSAEFTIFSIHNYDKPIVLKIWKLYNIFKFQTHKTAYIFKMVVSFFLWIPFYLFCDDFQTFFFNCNFFFFFRFYLGIFNYICLSFGSTPSRIFIEKLSEKILQFFNFQDFSYKR